jgi:hypothetical protein
MKTPWGKSDSKIIVKRGLSFVTTPSHGGFMVSKAYAGKHFSKAAIKRGKEYGSYLAYEEDCDYAVVVWEISGFDIPSNFPITSTDIPGIGKFTRESLIKSLTLWHADFLLERGVEPDAENLKWFNENRLQDRMREDKSPDLIVAAFGDWAEWVPAGKVGLQTADGKRHLVPSSNYQTRNLNLLSELIDVQEVL